MPLTRRTFLESSAAAAAAAALAPASLFAADSPNERRLVVGVMGTSGRGTSLATSFAKQVGCEVAYVCDTDQRNMGKAAEAVEKASGKAPQQVGDFHRILDDKAVDAIVIAAPDHWHAPATILGCAADKHVYVEKPCCHNPREGELAVEAARKHERVVQHGTQRRSYPTIIEAVAKLHEGAIGRVLFSRGWYNNQRPTIGNGQKAPVPEWLDYSLWQGPAPEVAYRDNLIHYNWHWFWHWGTGELGNNGIHSLDICRWGLGVDTPVKVTAGGGKYRYPGDDQETPDTHVVTYDFGGKSITWEGRSWSRRGFEGSGFGIAFYGENGSLVIDGGNYTIYDPKDKLVSEVKGSASDAPHIQNFLDSIRTNSKPHADIDTARQSVLLCHLGNIAYRTGRTLHLDPETKTIKNDAEAMQMWKREYRAGWEPKV